MHPIFAQPRRLILYVTACLFSGILLGLMLNAIHSRSMDRALAFSIPMAVFYGAACLAAWWVCRARPIDGRDPVPALLGLLWTALRFAAAWGVAGWIWGFVLSRATGNAPNNEIIAVDGLTLFALGIPIFLASIVVHYLFMAVEASYAAQQRALESQVTAREAELRALRAQLNPHFLFNSLNSINALVGGDPEKARAMCEGLGDFLRRTLQLGARESVTLGEELALVSRYLEIEQVRFGDRLKVERTIDPAALECMLPPLLLQPLVENAVKHGVAGRIEGGTVKIAAERLDGRLVVTLENPVDDDAPAREGEGMGIEIVRRRLAALDSRGASLVVTRPDDRFRVTLALEAREAPGAELAHAASEGGAHA
jgi:hypothetical protein